MRLALIASVLATSVACSSVTTPDRTAPASVAVTTVAVAEVDWPSRFEAGGTVLARESALISSRVLAPVLSVHVRPGDRVKRGDVLVRLDAADLTAQSARAARTASAAEYAVSAAAAEVQATAGAAALARATHARISGLHERRSATAQELDEATAALTAAEARHRAAQARLQEATAGQDAARAGADAASIAAGFITLTAPFGGVVVERLADPGTMATPGAPLLVVEDQTSFRMEVRVDAARAELLRLGAEVPVRLDGPASDSWITGRIAEIARIDAAAHSFAAKIDLPAGPGWRSGLFGRAQLAGTSQRSLAVPVSAIVQRGQLSYVFVIDRDVARLRVVSTGRVDRDRVEVQAGVKAGELVSSPVPPSLTDGASVSRSTAR